MTEDEFVERVTSGLWLRQMLLFRKVENVEGTELVRVLFGLVLLCSMTWFCGSEGQGRKTLSLSKLTDQDVIYEST